MHNVVPPINCTCTFYKVYVHVDCFTDIYTYWTSYSINNRLPYVVQIIDSVYDAQKILISYISTIINFGLVPFCTCIFCLVSPDSMCIIIIMHACYKVKLYCTLPRIQVEPRLHVHYFIM